MAAEIHFDFDASKLEIISISRGSFFQNEQQSIFDYELNNGSVKILTSILNHESPSFSGTIDLISIEAQSIALGANTLTFNSKNRLKDSLNNDIIIFSKINGLLEVYWCFYDLL